MMATRPISPSPVRIESLGEQHLGEADRIFRLAFGTFLGMPEPAQFAGDSDYLRPRWRTRHCDLYGAWLEDRLVGSNVGVHWGSFGFFGPLTVHPDFWDRGVGAQLVDPVVSGFDRRGIRSAGLFTFAQSAKHVNLYQKFGFWPKYLTAIMSKDVSPRPSAWPWRLYSELDPTQQAQALDQCREITSTIYEGLDLSDEIQAADEQRLGDTVLLDSDSGVAAFAVCHCGPGTEAGSNTCYIKFAAVRFGPAQAEAFHAMLDAVETLAHANGVKRVVAGVNTAREEAYRQLLARKFRTQIQGVAMQRGRDAGFNRAGVFVLDDWR